MSKVDEAVSSNKPSIMWPQNNPKRIRLTLSDPWAIGKRNLQFTK